MSRQEKGFYEFGPYRLDPVKRVLLHDRELVPLTPKAFATLLALVERQGELVEKDTLIETIWPDTFITEATLTQNIFRLRKALGEGAGDHRFIVTVPGRGYTFVAEVRRVEPASPVAVGVEVAEAVIEDRSDRSDPTDRSDEQQLAAPAAESAQEGAVRARHRRWTLVLSAGLVLAVVTLGLFILRPGLGRRVEQAGPGLGRPPRRAVAVLGFRNLSGRPEAAWLSTALAEMFTVELGVGEKLQTISGEAVARARMDLGLEDVENLSPTTLERLRVMLGCDVLLLGSYLDLGGQAGGKIRVDLRLQDTKTGETLAVATRTRTGSELFELVSDLGQELRQDLGGSAAPAEQGVIARASFPTDREAARFYAEGLQHLRTLDFLTARNLLQSATRAEPGFPLAHAALAMAWSSLGYDDQAEQESARALALADSLSREDRQLVEGLHEETRESWARAVKIYQDLWTFFPDDPEHGLRLARAQISAGQARDALATLVTLRRQARTPANDPRIDLTEAEAAAALSDFRREETLAGRAIAHGEALGARLLVARALQMRARAERVLGKPREALASIQRAEQIFAAAGDRAGIAEARFDTANLLAVQGDLPGARRLYEQALAIHLETGNQRGRLRVERHLGNVAAQLGDILTAKRYLADAVAIADEINERLERALALTTLASLQQSEGELAAAAQSFGEVLASFHAVGSIEGEGAAQVNISSVLRDQGNLPDAREHAERALRLLREIGHTRGTSFALNQLGALLIDQGDLERAFTTYRELGEIGRTTGIKDSQADAASGLGLLQAIQGNFGAARKYLDSALALHVQSQDRYDEAAGHLALARLELEEGHAAAAERDARSAADQLQLLHSRDDEALARAALARALLALGQPGPADQAMREALALTGESENRRVRVTVLVAAGEVAAATGRIAEARRILGTARDQAQAIGLWSQRLDALLALGRLELQQDPQRGRPVLQALSREADEKGFRRIADQATALLQR
jgi:DNA-binding winged helix-turn-helix (wHTH) protein/tetratricopeptide (TPR) repeat protein/TolB-like protein